jgi:hypothetical protein
MEAVCSRGRSALAIVSRNIGPSTPIEREEVDAPEL